MRSPRMHPRRLSGTVALGLALLAGGCGDDPAGPDAAALAAARGRWESSRPAAYEYLYRMSCFCPPQVLETARIRVEDGRVSDVFLVDSGTPAPPESLDLYDTIDGLFDRLGRDLERGPATFDVAYDEALGYPVSAVVDISVQIADEEYSFTASDLVAVAGP